MGRPVASLGAPIRADSACPSENDKPCPSDPPVFDTRGRALGVGLQDSAQLAVLVKLGFGEIAGFAQGGVNCLATVCLGDDEAVSVFPFRVFRVVFHLVEDQRRDDVRL